MQKEVAVEYGTSNMGMNGSRVVALRTETLVRNLPNKVSDEAESMSHRKTATGNGHLLA
jgi:hypothetical protein